MLSLFNKALNAIFGSKHEKDMKMYRPYVEKVNQEWNKLQNISDNELRQKTNELRQLIDKRLEHIDEKINQLHQKTQNDYSISVDEKEKIFNQIDALEKERNEELEKILLEVLPVAFAIVKDTARRYKENKKLEVTATEFDREIALRKKNVVIEGDKAIWHNQWEVAGNLITWEMIHYDVQIIGGAVLHQGKIAEMATGEGKTLVATLPAFLNALARRGVHIVTVNDYLSRRDSEWMAPLFEFHHITVDCIDLHDPHTEARKKAYEADITYGTNNEFGFDYLRDNMVNSIDELVQRRYHHYAMIDEVDSVLIDDARTPLIIAGPVSKGAEEQEYEALKPRIQRIVEAQKKLVTDYLNQAKKALQAGKEKEAGLPLFRAYRALPKHKPLIKLLSEPGVKVLLQKTENTYLADNQRLMPEADKPLYFTIDEKNNQIDLTGLGIEFLTQNSDDPNFFVMPDIGAEIAKIENDKSIDDDERIARKQQVIEDYSTKSQRIHTIQQLLKAYTLFEREVDYIIVDNEVKIVDEQTGRVMTGRRYSDGLHQALEAKENVRVQDATQTYATITLQNFFRMYHKLAGMTGTAETEAGELWDIYKLDVVVIPTNVKVIRKDANDLVYRTVREKFNAIIEEIVRLREAGRPVLVGTTSVEYSELLSRMLLLRKIEHQVLNAKLHQKEAEIVAFAGRAGTVTIATNMAGRGTDIKLTPEAKQAGGLAIIGTERHESRRVDRQLRGRAGRQGDPGSSQFFVSLEDNLMRLFGSDRIAKVMDRFGFKEGEVIQHSMITKSIERAQKKVEENNFGMRKRLLEYDDVMNMQRKMIYKRRRNALYGDRLQIDISNIIADTCEDIVKNYQASNNLDNFRVEVRRIFGVDFHITKEEFEHSDSNALSLKLYHFISDHYAQKNQQIINHSLPTFKEVYAQHKDNVTNIVVPITDGHLEMHLNLELAKVVESEGKELIKAIEKNITLALIDQEWKEHLRDMDDLKQSVQNAVWEQKDPLVIYKFEALDLFRNFVAKVNKDTVAFLMKANLMVEREEDIQAAKNIKKPAPPKKIKESKEEIRDILDIMVQREFLNLEEKVEKITPTQTRSQKTKSPNDRVNVQYQDGRVVKDVKYKTIEDDLKKNRCILID
jgi:preprotein translocase subunit SecA